VKKKADLFDQIAPFYGLFYTMQKNSYRQIFGAILPRLDLRPPASVLDVGCGTGALCSALHELGFVVTGIDPAVKMLDIAKKKNVQADIRFVQGSAMAGLPFADNEFDCVLASYVAHGFKSRERFILYREMARVSRNLVLLHDFRSQASIFVDFVEKLEGSDYRNFIRQVEGEMAEIFPKTRTVHVSSRASWYIGENAK
jgi:ubiquinone/menaquinone biosynthesis C-methylase UbiE